MSDIETQARIIAQSHQVREELKNLFTWEQEMKIREAKRAQVNDNEVSLYFVSIRKYILKYIIFIMLFLRHLIKVTQFEIKIKHQNHRSVNRHRHQK